MHPVEKFLNQGSISQIIHGRKSFTCK